MFLIIKWVALDPISTLSTHQSTRNILISMTFGFLRVSAADGVNDYIRVIGSQWYKTEVNRETDSTKQEFLVRHCVREYNRWIYVS